MTTKECNIKRYLLVGFLSLNRLAFPLIFVVFMLLDYLIEGTHNFCMCDVISYIAMLVIVSVFEPSLYCSHVRLDISRFTPSTFCTISGMYVSVHVYKSEV